MSSLRNHVVLIGFKHAGKSVIGGNLAKKLCVPFVDLDKKIELLYEDKFDEQITCRQIMQNKGEKFFRYLETNALFHVVNSNPSIISLGGGTPLSAENQRIIKPYILIHITAPQGVIYERIIMNGRPAFFNSGEELLESFNRLWDERINIYEKIKDFSILNNSSINDSVNKIIQKLSLGE